MPGEKFARFVVCPDERGLILGRSFHNMFKPGVVYQVSEILGTFLITEAGSSAMKSIPRDGPGLPDLLYQFGC
jgi:hypothetical protein